MQVLKFPAGASRPFVVGRADLATLQKALIWYLYMEDICYDLLIYEFLMLEKPNHL